MGGLILPLESHNKKTAMEYTRTIIIGKIEFLNIGCIIHSIEEVFKGGSKEETDALTDIPEREGKDWIVIEDYRGQIRLTKQCLINLVS
jgi:flagellar basal body rod protein FlgG